MEITDDPALPAPAAEAPPVVDVDADGVRVRDSIYLFLSRLVDPFVQASFPLPRQHQQQEGSGAGGGGEEGAAAGELTYILDQMRRISTSADWATCVVVWSDLMAFDEAAALVIEGDYQRFAPFVDDALHRVLLQYYAEDYSNRGVCRPALVFARVPRCLTIRSLRASLVGHLCSIRGVVTRTSQVRPELLAGVFRCGDCGTESLPVEQQFHYTEPPSCRNPQCENKIRFQLVPQHPQTRFGDWQKLRMQEDANHIPAGCMPRTVEVIVRGDAVEVAKPGDRVVAVGCPIVVPEVAKLMNIANRREVQRQMTGAQRAQQEAQADLEGATGLRALGVRELSYRMCFLGTTITDPTGDPRKMTEAVKDAAAEGGGGVGGGSAPPDGASMRPEVVLTPAEQQKVLQMRSHDSLLKALTLCVAPNIFKHEVAKLGLLLQMVGGVPKRTLESISLRGDINVCIVGDPSTAKSQLLKWVAANMPRGVYTSGKASTASGLTATVTRDADTGERTIEAGALMLADHGVCCIDEFDKMEIKDQVAIHEAMEQQTISIAKAGIKATLSARTSLLAALNPIGGRYDRRKTLQKNITMTAPIMSRFDLMFVIVDDGGDEADYAVADQLLRLHRLGGAAVRSPFSTEDFQLYLRYARSLSPRLTPEASQLIVAAYRDMRLQDSLSNRSKVYRVTTRLLESVIRLAEATAKLHLSPDVLPSHVAVALELMRQSLSTLDMSEVELVGDMDSAGGAAEEEEEGGGAGGHRSAGGASFEVKKEPHAGATASSSASATAGGPSSAAPTATGGGGGGGAEGAGAESVASGVTGDTQSVAASHPHHPQKQQQQSRKVMITSDHYFSIVNQLTGRLVALGEAAAPTRQELVAWYLEQVRSLNRAQLETELRFANLVLQRMIREGKVLEVRMGDGDGDVPRIFLDPNYIPDVTQR